MVGRAVTAGSLREDMVDMVDSHMVAAADTAEAPAGLDTVDPDRLAAWDKAAPERRKAEQDQDMAAVDRVDTSSVQKERTSMSSYQSIRPAHPYPRQSPLPEQYQKQPHQHHRQ
jgi:hypothetical protein